MLWTCLPARRGASYNRAMATRLRIVILVFGLLTPVAARGVEWIETGDGARLEGKLGGDARNGFHFTPRGGGTPLALETLRRIRFEPVAPDRTRPLPLFSVLLRPRGRIAGRLGSLDADHLRFEAGMNDSRLTIHRAGIKALIQRPGEALVLADGFETIDAKRWTITGQPESITEPVREGKRGLKLPAGKTILSALLPEEFASGRLELSYFDDARQFAGQMMSVELVFRGLGGPETVQSVLGWEDESLAVRTRGMGPALAVQPLRREAGWHRLAFRFHPDRIDVTVDGNELAHGDGPSGPLREVRIGTETPRGSPVEGLAAVVDDLRLVHYSEPTGQIEVDPDQDEARLVSGDQVFGRVRAANAEGLTAVIDDREARLSWSEVAGIAFQRQAVPARPLDGDWVRVSWGAGAAQDAAERDELEGVLQAITDQNLIIQAPYIDGPVNVPRGQVFELVVLGRAWRWVLDSGSHHLGNSVIADLDPPQPEGKSLEQTFELKAVPKGQAMLALDVVQVVGIEGDLDFSALVRGGQLLTTAVLNGKTIDSLNRHVTTRNDTPLRVRLPIPADVLRPGRNVLRIELAGTKDDPEMVDNLGVLGIALEARHD